MVVVTVLAEIYFFFDVLVLDVANAVTDASIIVAAHSIKSVFLINFFILI